MAGQPQVRESGVLYGQDPYVALAMVRLEERMDGTGWDLYLADPASAPSQHVRYPDEAGARAELQRVYEAGREKGEWKIHRPESY